MSKADRGYLLFGQNRAISSVICNIPLIDAKWKIADFRCADYVEESKLRDKKNPA
jgi:hypothetical protein